jgi:HNH endonuclease
MNQEERLCIVCSTKKAAKHRLKCNSCKNAHLKDVERECSDCHDNLAAPGRKICCNCKLQRYLAAHPENIQKINARRNIRYKTNANGCKTRSLAKLAIYREGRREEAREVSRRWREANPDWHRENNRRWRKKNAERIQQKSKLYALQNPQKIRFNNKLRKARLRKANIGTITVVLWEERIQYFGQHCAYCLCKIDEVTMEHMTPIVRGGLHDIDNVVPACSACNSRKQNRNLLEWVLYIRGIRCKGIGNVRPTGGRPRKQGV